MSVRGGAADKSGDALGSHDNRSREVLIIGVIKGGGEIEYVVVDYPNTNVATVSTNRPLF